VSAFVSIITAIHLAALSAVESGDTDAAIGAFGEKSRYQIMPGVAMSAVEKYRELRDIRLTVDWPLNEPLARRIAKTIWTHQLIHFQMRYQRSPSLPELYLLWHRPGRPLDPTPVEWERALRFRNVVESLTKKP